MRPCLRQRRRRDVAMSRTWGAPTESLRLRKSEKDSRLLSEQGRLRHQSIQQARAQIFP